MSEKIEPALTATEWSELLAPPVDSHQGIQHVGNCDICSGQHYGAARIAIANYLLPDSDPRKITRETIALLRAAAHACSEDDYYIAAYLGRADYFWGRETLLADHFAAIADALESYLPPA